MVTVVNVFTNKNRHNQLDRHQYTKMCNSAIISCATCANMTEFIDRCRNDIPNVSVTMEVDQLWVVHEQMDLEQPKATMKYVVCTDCVNKSMMWNTFTVVDIDLLTINCMSIYTSMVMDGCVTLVLVRDANGNVVHYSCPIAKGKSVVRIDHYDY